MTVSPPTPIFSPLRRQGIIVVATLVDKLPNLAGLARTCEVFRAAQLVVPDIRCGHVRCEQQNGIAGTSPFLPDESPSQVSPIPSALSPPPLLRMASDPAFSAISVTAEQWVPMVEVKEGALLPWLVRKQAHG